MNTRVLVCVLALAAAGACSKKKNEDGGGGGAATKQTGSTTGSGSAQATGSGSAQAATGSASGSAAPEQPKYDAKVLERGQYLVSLAGCAMCHMPMGPNGPDFSRAFAGGMEVPEKFGTWRAPNITPHKGSGIGAWSDEEIINAIRMGVRPDGSKLYPIMPYLNYNRLTDDDAKAIVAFLRMVPPVDNVVAPT
jgi:hypothetical protein